MGKKCDGCTKCCEGWLVANIADQKLYPGKPCYFVEIGKGCGTFENRPDSLCNNYFCGWMNIDDMPEEFKPKVSGVIMTWQEYWVLVKAPNNPTPQFLSWAISYARSRNQNILWYIDDKSYWLGDYQFCKEMEIAHSG